MKSSKSKKCTCANSILFPHRADMCVLRSTRSRAKKAEADQDPVESTDTPELPTGETPAPAAATVSRKKEKPDPKPKTEKPDGAVAQELEPDEDVVIIGTPEPRLSKNATKDAQVSVAGNMVSDLAMKNLSLSDCPAAAPPTPSAVSGTMNTSDSTVAPPPPPSIPEIGPEDTFVLPTAVEVNGSPVAAIAVAEADIRAAELALQQQRQAQQRQLEVQAAQLREAELSLRRQQEQQRQQHEHQMQAMRMRQQQMELEVQQERMRMQQERRYQEERNRMSTRPVARCGGTSSGRYGITQAGTVCKNCIKLGGRCHQHR